MTDTRGKGRCRLCSASPSNVDHHFINDFDGVAITICGAWWHYMLVHFVTLAPELRLRLLAIDPTKVKTGETVAYRSARTIQIFFAEKDDRVHLVGQAVDVELFNHLRELVKRCGGDVPSALAEAPVKSIGVGVGLDGVGFEEQLESFVKSSSSSDDLATLWGKRVEEVCQRLKISFSGIDLGNLSAQRKDAFRQLIATAFGEAGFESGKDVFVTLGTNPNGAVPMYSKAIGSPANGAYNLEVYLEGAVLKVFLSPRHDRLR